MRRLIVILLAIATLVCGTAAQARAEQIYALGGFGRSLDSFDSSAPGAAVRQVITGLPPDNVFIDLDYRPSSGLLYGITGTRQLYIINPLTAQATFVSTLPIGVLRGRAGIDFDPVEDRLRLVAESAENVRINVDTGQVIMDRGIVDPQISGVAYTNNFVGATSTTLYGIATASDSLYRIDPAAGTATLVGDLGVDVFDRNGFDISGESGIAYAALRLSGAQFSNFYRINLATGQATLVGQVGPGSGFVTEGLTVVPAGGGSAIPEPATIVLLGTGLLAVGAAMRHRS